MGIADWSAMLGVLVLVALINWRGQRSKQDSVGDYLFAGRNTGVFALMATLVMTELNTSTMVGFATLGYLDGYRAISLASVFLFGLLFYSLVVARRWKRYDGFSVSGYFSDRYHPMLGQLAALVLFVAMAGFSANYIKSLALLMQPLFPSVSLPLVSALFSILVLALVLRGGLRAIIGFDRLSFLLVLLFVPALYYFSRQLGGGAELPPIQFGHLSSQFVWSLVIITCMTYILAPWYGQKIFAAHRERTALWAMLICSVFVFLLYAGIIAAAAEVRRQGVVLADPQQVIPYLVANGLPPYIRGASYALLFCIAATTLAGVWSAMVSIILGPGVLGTHRQQGSSSTGMLWTLGCALLSWLGATFFVDHILDKMILMNIPISALAFSLLAGFYWKRVSTPSALVSILVGLIGGFYCYFAYSEATYSWYWAVYAIPASFIAGAVWTWLSGYFGGSSVQQEVSCRLEGK
ncbi:sodium:solute symporter family protein [Dongshaea marina]|uniref:sodium:solute symporter family protein n=1 Tax=Dongshaea marina TaxID=2047966 RepID=UPI000D3E67C8|nr:sodium:solute symporter [Dongshaea marina]